MIARGLKINSNIVLEIKENSSIISRYTGKYPGGQSALDGRIRQLSEPYKLPHEYDLSDFKDVDIEKVLKENGYTITRKSGEYIFELEYEGNEQEAGHVLIDALSRILWKKEENKRNKKA